MHVRWLARFLNHQQYGERWWFSMAMLVYRRGTYPSIFVYNLYLRSIPPFVLFYWQELFFFLFSFQLWRIYGFCCHLWRLFDSKIKLLSPKAALRPKYYINHTLPGFPRKQDITPTKREASIFFKVSQKGNTMELIPPSAVFEWEIRGDVLNCGRKVDKRSQICTSKRLVAILFSKSLSRKPKNRKVDLSRWESFAPFSHWGISLGQMSKVTRNNKIQTFIFHESYSRLTLF